MKKSYAKVFALVLAVIMLFAVTACTPTPAPPADSQAPVVTDTDQPTPTKAEVTPKVGIVMPTKSLQRWNEDGTYMEKMFKEAGYEVDLQYGADEKDVAGQIAHIENMIATGCGVLIIAANDGSSLTTALEDAITKDIPVIAYDRPINNTAAIKYYATFDNLLVGKMQGKAIEEKLDLKNAAGPFNIEFFTGDPGDANIIPFFNGAMEILKPYLDSGKLVCKSKQTEMLTVATQGWSAENAQKRMEDLISAQNYGPKKTKLDAVMCSNDSTAQGASVALVNAGFTKDDFPVITGQDCDKISCVNMRNGTQYQSVFKDTRVLAAQVVKMVTQYFNGETVDVNDTSSYNFGPSEANVPSYLCEPFSYTVADLGKLVDSAYYAWDDIGGEKGKLPLDDLMK